MGNNEETWYQSHQPGAKAQVDSFHRLDRLHLPQNMDGYRVLDLGCNEGFFCNQAALRGASEVIGIDIDEKFLSRARLLYGSNEKIKFLRQSWRELPEGKFDLILWTSGMHYELDPYPVLQGIASRLKSSGIFILECGVHPHQGSAMIRSTRHDGTFWYPTKDYLEFMLRKSGFAFRVVSEPEEVGLDPVPRAVYHCNLLKPSILLIVGESKIGKSFLANQLSSSVTKTISLDWFISRIATSSCAHTRLERFIKESLDKRDLRKIFVAIDDNGFTEEYIKQILLGISTSDELVIIEGFMTQTQIETFRRLAGNFANIWIVQRYTAPLNRLREQVAQSEQQIGALQAQLQAERERLTQQVAEKEQAIQQLQSQLAERERALQAQLASLQQRLSWKRYRIADRLLSYYWYLWHPKQAWQRVRGRAWELGRRWLPYSAKRWIKRFILKQTSVTANPSTTLLAAPAPQNETSAFKVPKLPRYDVIYFPIIDWDFRYQRSQHLCSQFALHGHRVFYLKTTFAQIQRPDAGSIFKVPMRLIKENVYEVQLPGPVDLNIYQHQISPQELDVFFEAFRQLRRAQSIHEAICVVALPFWRPLVAKLREAFGWKIIYDCLDEHQGFSTNQPPMLAEEPRIARESDLVIVTSSRLFNKMQALNKNCLLVPNAADFQHFCAPFGEPPRELAGLPRPIIGYYGAISGWFDTTLIRQIAKQRPKWSFVLIGSTFGADLAPLQGLSNVHLLGEKPYLRLPAYLHQFDVCIIPFKLTPLAEAINPVKFFELLSAGKPVVSVPLPELLPYEKEGLVYIAGTPDEYVEQIERALRENSLERIHARMKFAAGQTWEERFDSLYRTINALYPKVSIIMLTKDNLHLTKMCLDSIYRNTLYPNFEVIVVDNASTDGTREYLQQQMEAYINLKVIFNEKNEGFARANNQGILNASGDYIVLLNNDTVVTRGWLGRLVRYLEIDSKVGMVGPVTNLAGNEAKIGVPYTSQTEMEEFADRYVFDQEKQHFEIKVLAMFCVAMRRELIDEVGLLDERFGIGMFEDDDYSHRVKLRGYKLVCAEDVFIHHFGMSTMKKLNEQEYWALFESNRKKFERKWGIRWEPHKYREKG